MALNMESCSIEDACTSVDGSVELLIELRDRLQDWLKMQPHLPQDVSKKILEQFLIGTKMSLEQAKRKLDMFYTMKGIAPELFTNTDPRGAGITSLHTMIQTAYLPKLTHEKWGVCIFRPFVDDYSKLDAYDCAKYFLMIENILMAESRDLGRVFVIDHANLTFGLVAKATPTVVKKCEIAVTEAYAKRIKGVHFINPTPLTENLIALFKRIVKPKLAARIHTHPRGSYESLYQHVPKHILPKDYGGEEESMDRLAELWRQKVDEKRDWILEQEKILVDERLRPGPAINADNIFGFSGSFRKLDVD